MDDYYRQCLALEELLDEYEPHRRKALAFFESLSREVADNPKLSPTIELVRRIMDIDLQILTALRTEIAKAKDLNRLPHNEQVAFYDREITPIQAEIDRLAIEQLAVLREAQQRGLKLPGDILEFLEDN